MNNFNHVSAANQCENEENNFNQNIIDNNKANKNPNGTEKLVCSHAAAHNNKSYMFPNTLLSRLNQFLSYEFIKNNSTIFAKSDFTKSNLRRNSNFGNFVYNHHPISSNPLIAFNTKNYNFISNQRNISNLTDNIDLFKSTKLFWSIKV